MNLTQEQQEARSKICLPLDGLNTMDEIMQRVQTLSPVVGLFKIGKETFTKLGPESVKRVQEYGGEVFLDLKYHDIPNTVKGAAEAAANLEVYMFNVHAPGGYEMMMAAVEGAHNASAKSGLQPPKITGVTVLTSIDEMRYIHNALPILENLAMGPHGRERDELHQFPYTDAIDMDIAIRKITHNPSQKKQLEEKFNSRYAEPFQSLCSSLGLNGFIQNAVKHYAGMANDAGLDGIVCSAADLSKVQPSLPDSFMYVTPGIQRPGIAAGSDQKRVFTPGNAIQDGSSILVVGRAITDPRTPDQKNEGVVVTADMQLAAGYSIIEDMVPYLKK